MTTYQPATPHSNSILRPNCQCPLSANSGHANRNHLRLRLGTYRTLHFRECLFARVLVASAIGGVRTQHGLSDSRNGRIEYV